MTSHPDADRPAGAQSGYSRLQSDLAAHIVQMLSLEGRCTGYRLNELDLCQTFNVSRTPVRGALQLLAERGVVEHRDRRGFVLLASLAMEQDSDPRSVDRKETNQLAISIAHARLNGRLGDLATQHEIMRVLGIKSSAVSLFMHRLVELGVADRRPGHGWKFISSVDRRRVRRESYDYRIVLETRMLMEPTFEFDEEWSKRSRADHLSLLDREWRDELAIEFLELDSDFHEQLARCSGNRYILEDVRRQNRLRVFLDPQWLHGPDRIVDAVGEHLMVIDALDRGDRERASDLMREHLVMARDSGPVSE